MPPQPPPQLASSWGVLSRSLWLAFSLLLGIKPHIEFSFLQSAFWILFFPRLFFLFSVCTPPLFWWYCSPSTADYLYQVIWHSSSPNVMYTPSYLPTILSCELWTWRFPSLIHDLWLTSQIIFPLQSSSSDLMTKGGGFLSQRLCPWPFPFLPSGHSSYPEHLLGAGCVVFSSGPLFLLQWKRTFRIKAVS